MKGFITSNGIPILVRARAGENYDEALKNMAEKWAYTGEFIDATEIIKLSDVIEGLPTSPTSSSVKPSSMRSFDKKDSKPAWKIEAEEQKEKSEEPYWKRVQKLNSKF